MSEQERRQRATRELTNLLSRVANEHLKMKKSFKGLQRRTNTDREEETMLERKEESNGVRAELI